MPSSAKQSSGRILAAMGVVLFATAACGVGLGDVMSAPDICPPSGYDPVSRVKLQPAEVTLRVGVSATLQPSLIGSTGEPLFLCQPPLYWTSANPSIASVAEGLVVGVSPGVTFIRALAGGKVDSSRVTVTGARLASVTIEPASLSLLVGQTARMSVVARDTDGNLTQPASVNWASDNATIATITQVGTLTAIEPGTVTVRAIVEGIEAFAQIPITRDPPAVRFQAIAPGFEHTCAIVGGGGIPDGTAYCWGNGSHGQLGNGATVSSATPRRVLGIPPLTALAASSNSTCGVTALGEVYCWGANEGGQLGDGTTVDRSLPVRLATSRAFRTVTGGGELVCGLTSEGAAYCWGRGNSASAASAPTLVPGGIQFLELTGGDGFVCGRATGGRAYCWGSGIEWVAGLVPALMSDIPFSQISAGAYHACGLVAADNTAVCWGRITRQLGPGVAQGLYRQPIRVPGEIRFTSIAAGGGFTCGTTDAGSYCLGLAGLRNDGGLDPLPKPIPKESEYRFARIVGGPFHACAIDRVGGGWCWGMNLYGQVGVADFVSETPLQLRIR